MRRTQICIVLAASAALLTVGCGERQNATQDEAVYEISTEENVSADFILQGGRIATVDEHFSFAEALAIKGSRIVYVGDNNGVSKFRGDNTRIVELDGRFVMPGFADAHCHPYNLGAPEEDNFSVAGSRSFDEVVDKVAAKVATLEPGEWLIGGGWSEQDWPGKQSPVHDKLSAVTPDNPVFLYRRGGNSSFVNAKAMEIAGITKDTPDPYGGKIHRKENGEPTGFLVNMGNNIVKAHFPDPNHPDTYYRARYTEAARISNEAGLTSWHDAGADPKTIEIYKQLVDRGELNIRVNMMLQNPRYDYGKTVDYFTRHRTINYGGEDMFQVRSVKMFFDGALGSRGAALYKEYSDAPGEFGVFEVPPEHMLDVVRAGLATGMQISPHAIGTRGNGVFLDSLEQALTESSVVDHRFRSEHAQIVRPQDVPRFAELGVIASMQPIHAIYDKSFAEERLGHERTKSSAYIWRTFLDAGVIVASGSDFTVVSHRPLWGFYAAVSRRDMEGQPEGGWYHDQAMTREEALKSYTIWPAYAAFMEDRLGSLEAGKYADIVVLDQDILSVPEDAIPETNVMMTIVNGEIVYER